MQKRDERMDALTDARTHLRKAFYNLPTTAFGRRRQIKRMAAFQWVNFAFVTCFSGITVT